MTIADEIIRELDNCFTILILDNEVTLDAFIAEPPLKWVRLINVDGSYKIPDSYPTSLTKSESDREELNWDKVDLELLRRHLNDLNPQIDLVAIGNNAAQGLPLAEALPASMRAENGVIIYGSSLPEQPIYGALGYKNFCARSDLLDFALPLAKSNGCDPALAFINTIEHNDQNYHAPWTGR